MPAWETYYKELLSRGHGHALWDADPGEQPALDIADVGYMYEGAFVRLFNASKQIGDVSNRLGTPVGYKPIRVGEIMEGTLSASQPITSETVLQRGVDVNVSGGPTVQPFGGFSFQCTKETGAALIIGEDAERRNALEKHIFIRYILENHHVWLKFANDIHNRGINLDELILVTGCDRTSAWASAAFSASSNQLGVEFRIGDVAVAQGGLSVWGSWRNCQSVQVNSGPRVRHTKPLGSQPTATELDAANLLSRPDPEHEPTATDQFAVGDVRQRFGFKTEQNATDLSREEDDHSKALCSTLRGHIVLFSAFLARMLFCICNFFVAVISGNHRVHSLQPLLPEAVVWDQGTLLSFPHTDDTRSSQVPTFTDDSASTLTLTPPIPSPPRNQCIFLRGFKVCDRSSLKKRLRRLGRNKSSADDGFTRLPVVRSQRDDKDDRGRASSSSERASSGGVREAEGGHDEDTGQDSSPGSGSSCQNSSGSQDSLGLSSETDSTSFVDTEQSDHKHALYPHCNGIPPLTPLDILMEYIFEKSSADLALVHHDDLSTLLGATTSTGVEDALCQLTPIVFVKNGVGMLESTFKAYQNTKPMNANTSMPPSIIFPEQAPLPGNASVTSHEQRAHEEERSVLSTSFLEVNVSQLCNDTAHDSRHGNEGQDRDHEDSFDTKKIPSLSLAANVISVLQFTSTALGKCYCYASPARDASRDQKRVIDQLSGLLKVLEDVYQLVDHGETGEPSGLLALTGLLNNPLGFPCCRSELESLGTVLGIEPGRGGHTQALTWPLKEADVNRTLSKLSQFQDLLATALDVDQRYLSVGGCLTVGEQSVPRARSCHRLGGLDLSGNIIPRDRGPPSLEDDRRPHLFPSISDQDEGLGHAPVDIIFFDDNSLLESTLNPPFPPYSRIMYNQDMVPQRASDLPSVPSRPAGTHGCRAPQPESLHPSRARREESAVRERFVMHNRDMVPQQASDLPSVPNGSRRSDSHQPPSIRTHLPEFCTPESAAVQPPLNASYGYDRPSQSERYPPSEESTPSSYTRGRRAPLSENLHPSRARREESAAREPFVTYNRDMVPQQASDLPSVPPRPARTHGRRAPQSENLDPSPARREESAARERFVMHNRDVQASDLPSVPNGSQRSDSHELPSLRTHLCEFFTPESAAVQPPINASYGYDVVMYNRDTVPQRASDLPSVPPRPARAPSGDPGRRFGCELCDERYDRQSGLDIHLRSRPHEDKRPYACSQPGCSKTFSVECNLRRHTRTHNGDSTVELTI